MEGEGFDFERVCQKCILQKQNITWILGMLQL